MESRIVCWNVNWAKPGSARGDELKRRITRQKPEIICISEGYCEYLGPAGHAIYSAADYGYAIVEGRRKVFLWSKMPWREIDEIGHPSMPTGRFVAGVTQTSIGDVRVVGLCIPWQMAHVSTGQKNRAPWEVHLTYLRGLKLYLASLKDNMPIILSGDFNQRLPRGRQPWQAYKLLAEMLADQFDIWTVGEVKGLDRQPVCHIGGSKELASRHVSGRTRMDQTGRQLTDHDGLVCRFMVA